MSISFALSGMLAVSLLAQQPPRPFKPNAELGKPYVLGHKMYIGGTRTELPSDTERTVTLNSVRTALAVATQQQTFPAMPGKKYLLLDCSIKNPCKLPIAVSAAETVRVLIWEKELAKSFEYHTSVRRDLGPLSLQLKPGQSTDIVAIVSAPQETPFVHLGLSYRVQGFKSSRWYDVIPLATKAASAFSSDGFNFVDTAAVPADTAAPFEAFEAKAGRTRPLAGNGLAVDVQMKNRMLLPTKWGWQYAAASLVTDTGEKVAFYPEIINKATGSAWTGEITAGETMTFEYRFYPGKAFAPRKFILQMAATKRSLEVDLAQ